MGSIACYLSKCLVGNKIKNKKSPSPEHLAPKSKEKEASFIMAPVLSSATDTD